MARIDSGGCSVSADWLHYADPPLDPIRRSRTGSITPIIDWLQYADHEVAPLRRSVTEVFFMGVLVRGLRSHGLSIAIGLPLLMRVLGHLYQGPMGVLWILAFGLLFSICYVRRPVLWPLVLAHILWDIYPFTTLAE
jgi:hypothetical protein